METPPERSATERFQRADAVFDAALDLTLGERAAYVERACGGDPVLRADVERLLRAHSQSDGFLSTPAGSRAELLMAQFDAPNDGAPAALPDRIGPYRISSEIGRGGMGIVYLAERDDPDFPQRVALKVVRALTADGNTYVSHFLNERLVLASLEHPHIARLFDGGVTRDGLPYYTMAYCEGGSLAQRLAANGKLPVDEALRIARELASALGAAHAHGVMHRDVKPANILFDAEGSVRLSDFGVAKLLDDDSMRSGTVLGTVAYLAPEQVRGERTDHRADLWALGVTLYEMIAGCRPFDGPSYAAVLHAIVSTEPVPLRQRVPSIPAAAESLVTRLLQKQAAHRPESAAAVVRALDESDAVADRETARASPSRARRLTLVLSGALALVAGAATYFALRTGASPRAVETPAVVTLAVRPFVNNEGNATDDVFIAGLTQELTSVLGAMRGLHVSAPSSAVAHQPNSASVRTIAQTLGVDHVIEGSVRRSGDRRLVSVRLVRARDDSALWTHEYVVASATNMFAAQQTTAEQVATAVRQQFALAVSSRPGADAQAHFEYAAGRAALNNRSSGDDLHRAVTHFRAAIARDPEYAIAYSGLSDAYTSLANFGFGRPGPSTDSARSTATRALTLDSTLAEARTSLGHALCTHDYRWNDAEREFLRAIEHEPGYIYARTTYAICLQDQGRFSEALAQLDTARTLEPNRQAVGTVSGRVLVNDGKPDEAIRTLKRTIAINSKSDMAWQQLGHAYLLKGLRAEALDAFRNAAKLNVRDSAHLAYAYAVTGHPVQARWIVNSLVASRSHRYMPPFHIAMAYAGLGEVDEAFRWLDTAYAERSSFLDGVKVTAAFAPLHGDPRWSRLLAEMGLSPLAPAR